MISTLIFHKPQRRQYQVYRLRQIYLLNQLYLLQMKRLDLLFLLNGLLVIRFLDKYSGLLRHLFITVGLSLFVFLLFFISKFNYDSDSSHGVLIIKKVEVRSGPSETLPTLFYIHEGLALSLYLDCQLSFSLYCFCLHQVFYCRQKG